MCSLPKIVTSFPCDAHTKRMINKFSLRRNGTIKTVHSVFGFIFISICQPTNTEWDPLDVWRRAAAAENDKMRQREREREKCTSYIKVYVFLSRSSRNKAMESHRVFERAVPTHTRRDQIQSNSNYRPFSFVWLTTLSAISCASCSRTNATENKLNLFLCFTIFFRCFHSSHSIKRHGMGAE